MYTKVFRTAGQRMLSKIYLEITNVCNLNCQFCHKTSRAKRFLSDEEFKILLTKIEGKAKYLHFHLMGEPTLHPLLPKFIKSAKDKGFLPMITTNGTLLHKNSEALLSAHPHKVSISLHAPEANEAFASAGYLESCIAFSKQAAECGTVIALRLWNLGSGADNTKILDSLHTYFPGDWKELRNGASQRLADKIFLDWGKRFTWPDVSLPECSIDADRFCYGLRDQIGILSDGTVVPCCLDADANLALGNLFSSELEEILSSPRAKAIYNGFTGRRAVESFCRKCGYAHRFSKQKN